MFEIVYRSKPAGSPIQSRPATADEARVRLVEGNKLFARLIRNSSDPKALHQEIIPIDLTALGIDTGCEDVPSQQPFAAVLSCSDARVPVELIFHEACNDLFVVRLAGNIVTNECVGSIGYAVRNLDDNVKLVVVLGHTCCGAVAGAVDAYLEPTNYPGITSALGMRSILDRVFVSVRTGAQALERVGITRSNDEQNYRKLLLDLSVVLNSAMMAMSLQEIMSEVVSAECPVVFGVYDLASRLVWAPNIDSDAIPWVEPQLADPPATLDELVKLATQIAMWLRDGD